MESHPYEKTQGEGVPSTITSTSMNEAAEPQNDSHEASLCRYIDARGHRCRMLVARPESELCVHHAHRLERAHRQDDSAAELLASFSDFTDAASVNRFLTSLVRQITLKRIPRRQAITLAYISQLLLNSLDSIRREEALRLEESRIQAMNAAKRPPKILWDIPGPPHEPSAEEVFEKTYGKPYEGAYLDERNR